MANGEIFTGPSPLHGAPVHGRAFSCALDRRSAMALCARMLLKIICRCGHIGVVDAQTLPRELRCWQCGSSRRVEAKGAQRVASRTAIIEWLCGAEAPRAQAR